MLVLVVLGGCGEDPAAGRSDVSGQASAPASPAPTEVTAGQADAAPSETRDSRPTSLRLPSGATVPVRVATTGGGGLLQVPADIRAAGWWDGGARVGAAYGAIVVAGHVDSRTQGVGPFAELLSVRRGQPVKVQAQGLRQSFAVSRVDLVRKATLDTRGDIFAASGPVRLVLITCAGAYDPQHGGYQDLAVVLARPLGRAVETGT